MVVSEGYLLVAGAVTGAYASLIAGVPSGRDGRIAVLLDCVVTLGFVPWSRSTAREATPITRVLPTSGVRYEPSA